MKKILTSLIALLFIGTLAVKAQSEKETKPPPPPPPPKKVDVVVKAPPPPEKIIYEEIKTPPVITVTGKRADEFYKQNPPISSISRQGNMITLKMKDGREEKYDMNKEEENKNFTDKYGVSPIPPPPPPKIVDEKIKVPPPPPPAPPKPKKIT